MPEGTVYSVAQLTGYIRQRFDEDELLQDLWVEGEISNWSCSRAGHCYFTLKDAQAAIHAVIWRSLAMRLSFAPQDGQAVLAHGRVSVYEPHGQYQLYVDVLRPIGRGELYMELERLKARLAAEGLFDAERKRPLPPFPVTIGVVTSPTGAALRDIINVLSRRWPPARLILAPTLVQGESAPPQIVAALRALYRRDDVELIIVARGGGSIEDLWAFNDERVVRTVVESPVPVVSGVGHEVDWTLTDLAADVRAPTPSAAAEVSTPDWTEVDSQVMALADALIGIVRRRLDDARLALESQQRTLAYLSPRRRIERDRQQVDELAERLERAARHHLTLLSERTRGLAHRLQGLNPYATLERGYAIVRHADGRVVRRSDEVVAGERLAVRVADGEFAARVEL